MNKKSIEKRNTLINQILLSNNICTICGYTYTKDDLEKYSTIKLKFIIKNISKNIHTHSDKCFKTFKHKLTVKHCIKCNAEIKKSNKSNLCKSCKELEKHTIECPVCQEHVVVKTKLGFKCCDKCWEESNLFNSNMANFYEVGQNIKYTLFSNKKYMNSFENLIFEKFFNNKLYSVNDIKWYKLKYKNCSNIYNITNKFLSTLTNAYLKHKWNIKTILNIFKCLHNCYIQLEGFSTNFQEGVFNIEKELYGWKELLSDQLHNVIKMMNEFIINSRSGYGEFFWSIINNNVQCNYLKQSDILYKNNAKGEIKCAESKIKGGRLLFKRDAWFGFNNVNEYKKNIEFKLRQFYLAHNMSSECLNTYFNSANINDYSWNNIFKQIFNSLPVHLKNEFVNYMFTVITNGCRPYRFNEIDLTNENNFKLFHFVNYCLYYILEDAKNENLDKLIFISNDDILVVNTKMLLNNSTESFNNILSGWNIDFPNPGFTKTNISHDRNKNRAPGIYKI